MKPRVLITGGTGFIGRNLVEQLSSAYHVFAPTSRELDLVDDSQVSRYLRSHRFHTVLHAATHNATVVSDKDRSLVFKHNVRMYMNIARMHETYGRMIYFGSVAEYGKDVVPARVTEGFFDTYIPKDDYGYSKYLMRTYTRATPNVIDLCLFGVYGKYEDWRIRFISQNLCRVLYDMPIVVYQNALFDYLCISDLAPIVRWFVDRKTLLHQEYNVSTGKGTTLVTIAHMIANITGSTKKIFIKKGGMNHPVFGNPDRLLREMKDVRFTPLQEGIRELWAWYGKRKKTVQNITGLRDL